MNRATAQIREFAERLIFIEAKATKSSASETSVTSVTSVTFSEIDKLRPCFTQVVGALGFKAVLGRALAMGATEVEWLHAVHVKPDGFLEASDELRTKLDPKEITEGKVALLAEFVSLLVQLIGERLLIQLVHQAMPELSKDDLYFGESSKREKN